MKYVGNEGSDSKNTGLRKMFQACIDYVPAVNTAMWKDASITIYNDVDDEIYTIKSGNAKNKYICVMQANGPLVKPRHPGQSSTAGPADRKIEMPTGSCFVTYLFENGIYLFP